MDLRLIVLFIASFIDRPVKRLKEFGLHFGIGESGVSQTCRRVAQKIEKDKKLKKKAISEFPNNKIAYNIRPVLILRNL
ncbi:MAG: hypothetical protein GY786_10735 [Proteobacteria bacterium]|nr:hypothetical protein [Pseudomonadota bacterium]